MLISVHESSKSGSPFMKAISWWNVGHEDSNSSSFFNRSKLFLKPGKFVSWIVSLTEKIPVHIVASLGVDSNDFSVGNFLSIQKNKVLTVVSPLGKLLKGLISKPSLP